MRNERNVINSTITPDDAADLHSTEALLALHDTQFVQMAYLVLLGRTADAEGLTYYLTRLRNGVDKSQIVAEMKFSAEGRLYSRPITGLEAVLKSYSWLKSPVKRSMVRMRNGLGRHEEILSGLRVLDNQLFRQRDSLESGLFDVNQRVADISEKMQELEQDVEQGILNIQQSFQKQLDEQWVRAQIVDSKVDGQLEEISRQLTEHKSVFGDQIARHQVHISDLEIRLSSQLESLNAQVSHQHSLSAEYELQMVGRLDGLSQQFTEQQKLLEQQLINQQSASLSREADLSARLDELTQQLMQLNAARDALQQQEQEALISANAPTVTKEYRVAVRPLTFALPDLATEPKISIVVVQYHKSDVTGRCLRSLFRYTDMHDVEILVVDNGSAMEHVEALKTEFGDAIRILRLETNRLFGEGNNIGVEAARGELIVLMNNDIVVTAGWLGNLLPHLARNVGIVAPTFLYPDGRVQESGATVDEQGYPTQNLKFGKQSELPRNPFDCDYVSAALILMRKQDFLTVGGFALEYEPAYYEDVDLCLKIKARRLSVRCIPKVRVYHVENATSGSFPFGASIPSLLTMTRNVLVSRWHDYLQCRIADNLNTPSQSKLIPLEKLAYANDKPTALLYLPTIGLNEQTRYAMTIAHVLKDSHRLIFSSIDRYSRLRLWQLASHWGLSVADVENIAWDELPVDQEWDRVFVFGSTLFPSIASISDSSIYICDFPTDLRNPTWAHQVLSQGYQYWCQSEWIKHTFSEQGWVDSKKIKVLPQPVSRYSEAASKENIILSVGKFTNYNQQSRLIEAFARLASTGYFDDWQLVLMGSPGSLPHELAYLTHCMEQAEPLAVSFIFDDTVAKLSDLYGRASVYWHGAGLGVDADNQPELLDRAGVAALEAISAGCSVFIPNKGTVYEWMCAAPDHVYTCSNMDDLVSLMVEIKRSTGFDSSGARERIATWLQNRDLEQFANKVLLATELTDPEAV